MPPGWVTRVAWVGHASCVGGVRRPSGWGSRGGSDLGKGPFPHEIGPFPPGRRPLPVCQPGVGPAHEPLPCRAGIPACRFWGLSSPQLVRRAGKPAEPAAWKGCPTRFLAHEPAQMAPAPFQHERSPPPRGTRALPGCHPEVGPGSRLRLLGVKDHGVHKLVHRIVDDLDTDAPGGGIPDEGVAVLVCDRAIGSHVAPGGAFPGGDEHPIQS